MANNIFDGAKFGDKFRTRDGRMAIFIAKNEDCAAIIIKGEEYVRSYFLSGKSLWKGTDYNIVSRWVEPIDEEKLDLLADAYATKTDDEYMATHPKDNWRKEFVEYHFQDLAEAYKAGYRDAKQEQL